MGRDDAAGARDDSVEDAELARQKAAFSFTLE